MSNSQLIVSLKLASQLGRGLNTAQGRVKKFVNQTRNQFKKLATMPNMIMGGLVAGIGRAFYKAGAALEVYRQQLLMVTASAIEADSALSAIREFARTSPLETEDVVQSYVRLRAVGIDPTIEQMRTLGGVAVLFDRQMGDVLQGFIGLNKKVLRGLGIEIDRTGAKAIIQSGNIRKVVEKDSATIRQALVDTWAERFPDAIDKASNTMRSKLAIMKSNIWEVMAQIGERIAPIVSAWFDQLSSGIASIGDWFLDSALPWITKWVGYFELGVRTLYSVFSTFVTTAALNWKALIQGMMWLLKMFVDKFRGFIFWMQEHLSNTIKSGFLPEGMDVVARKTLSGLSKTQEALTKFSVTMSGKLDKNRREMGVYADEIVDGFGHVVDAFYRYDSIVNGKRNKPGGKLSGSGALGSDTESDAGSGQMNTLGLPSKADIKRAIREAEEELKRQRQIAEAHWARMVSLAEHAGNAISDAMVEAFSGKGLKGILKSILMNTLNYLEKEVLIAKVMTTVNALRMSGPLAPVAVAKAAAKIGAITALFGTAKAAVSSFARGGSFVADRPQMIMVGDNPGRSERVTVSPTGGGGGAGVTININERSIGDELVKAMRSGELNRWLSMAGMA